MNSDNSLISELIDQLITCQEALSILTCPSRVELSRDHKSESLGKDQLYCYEDCFALDHDKFLAVQNDLVELICQNKSLTEELVALRSAQSSPSNNENESVAESIGDRNSSISNSQLLALQKELQVQYELNVILKRQIQVTVRQLNELRQFIFHK